MRTFLGLSIVCLAAFAGQSNACAAPLATEVGKASPKSTVQIRFIDSATGYAVEPETVSTRLHRAHAAERHFGKGQQIQPGRASIALEHGSHTIAAISQHHKPMSGELNVKETQLYPIYFLLDPIEEPRELHSDYIAALQRDDAMLIQGFIVDEATGEPLPDVRVSSSPSGVNTSTDGRGFFQFHIPLPADSASEDSNLSFEKPGYRVQDREHLELWPRGDWTYRIRLERGNGRQRIDERTLRRRAPASAPSAKQEPIAEAPAAVQKQPVLLSSEEFDIEAATASGNASIRVPRNIRVEKNGVVYYVTLNYYVKRVLPSEWINSWANYTGGSNSLNAGAVVIRSYAINKINGAGASSDFDICGTSSCQVFNPTTTASASNRAVDYTDDWVMINSNGNIANTEYSAENNSIGSSCGDGFTAPSGGCLYDPACKGETRFGHGRGLCQWGSARWATGRRMAGRSSGDGTPNGFPLRDWIWILQHYYPNLALTKGVPLMIGDDIKARVSLNVRACSGGGIEGGVSCPLITTKSAGQTGTIIGGPTVVTNDGKGFTWYQVQWNDTSATTGWSAENYLERVFPLPTAPIGLIATAVSTNRINLNWTDTSDVESRFEIERAPASSGPWLRIGTVEANVTTYSDLNLYPASQWFYRVRAGNAGGASSYTAVANATTAGIPPVLAAIANRTITDGSLLTFTNSASASDRVQLITDFEPFLSEFANGVVLVRTPNFSSTTSGFLDGAPQTDLAAITDTFPAGQGTGKVLKVSCEFTNVNNAWLRLTTFNTETFANPVIDFTKKLRFDIHADRPVRVAVGCRETTTAAGTAIGANGGTTGGSIEWAGVTNVSSGAPMPNRTVSAGVWTNVMFDFPTEPIRSFTGGNGVLSTASGLGVLEHLAIVPTDGAGVYNFHLDNFAVLTPRILTYSLDAGAPAGASVHPTTGVFIWTPEANQAGAHNISVIVADNSVPQLRATNTFTVVVNEGQFAVAITSQPQGATVSVGANVTFNVEATGGALQYQWRRNGADLSNETNSSLSLTNVQSGNAGSYSVVVSNSVQSVISSDAVLTVLIPIEIISQPQNRTNNIGDNAFFSVGANGENISYQWQFNGGDIEGATGSSLNVPVDDISRAGTYNVVLSGPSFETAVSAGAVLSIPYGNLTKIAQWSFNSNPPDNDTTTGSLSPSVGSGTVALFGGVQSVFVNGAASDPASLGLDSSSWRIDSYPASTGENKSRGLQAEVSTAGYKDIVLTWERRQQAQASRYVRLQYTVDGINWFDHTVHELTVAAVYFFQASELFDIPNASNNPNFAFRIVPEWQSTAAGFGAAAYVSATGGAYSGSGNMLHDMLTVLGTPLNPPVLISSPASLTKNAGETAVLTASAMRADTVIWTRNGTPVGSGEIAVEGGVTTSTLTIPNVQSGDAGYYMATFFNEDALDGIASEAAAVTVLLPPSVTISRVPSTLAVMAGSKVLFTANAVSEFPVQYQWFKNDEPINNATSSTLEIDPLLPGDAGTYSVAASNEQGTTLSNSSSLSVLPDPNPPTVKINIPAKNQRVTEETVDNYQLVIDGTATDVERIRMVKYSINSAGYEDATVTLAANEKSLSWTAAIPIKVGTNILAVQAFDAAGRSSSVVTHSFFYAVPHPLLVNITGIGSISPNLNGASLEVTKSYSMLAVPLSGSNYMFTNWSKGVAPNDEVIASTPLLSFAMESNLVLNANFITNPFAKAMGIYYGLFAETDTNDTRVSHASSGGFTIKVNAKSGYSGKLLLDGNAVTFSGKFALAGDAVRTISRVKAGKPDLQINLQLNFAGGSRKISGIVSCVEEGWTASVEGNRLLFSAKNDHPATEFIGAYTMILPGAEESGPGPVGHGYGILSVNSNGILKVSGHLADGIKFKQAVGLTEDGTWAFYAPTYRDVEAFGKPFRGSLLGWLSISSNTPVGSVNLIHIGGGEIQYGAGYTNDITLIGSSWNPRMPPLTNSNLTITFTQGVFGSSSLVKNGVMNDKGALVIDRIHNGTDRVGASLGVKSGIFKASFLQDGLATRAFGAALQNQNMAFGFFVSEGKSGSVVLAPAIGN